MERRDLVVNNKQYSMLLPSVRDGMRLASRVMVLIGPLLGSLGKDVQKEAGWEVFASAISHINPEELDALFMKAVTDGHLCCAGQPISALIEFEKHFSQHRSEVYQVSAWCLWESVKDFLPQTGVSFQKVMEKMGGASVFRMGGQRTGGSVDPSGQGSASGPITPTAA